MCEFISIILAHGRQGWPRKKMVPAGSNQQVIMYSVRECTAGLSIWFCPLLAIIIIIQT